MTLNDAVDLSEYVRDRGLPQVLDFPFQQVASAYASGATGSKGVANRLADDDYFRTANGVDPSFTTFLGNHDMGRAAQQILTQAPGLTGQSLVQHVLLGYDLLYLLRGAPAVLYGDEVGMIGSGGDQQARQDMFPTQVSDWQTQPRVGSPPIGKGSSFAVTDNPIQAQLRTLSALRDAHPELSTGSSVVRYAQNGVLVVSRIDLASGKEVVVGFNNGATAAHVTVATATPGASWSIAFGSGTASGSLALTIPPVSAVLAVPSASLPATPAATPGADGQARRADVALSPLGQRPRRARIGDVRDAAQGRHLAARRRRRLGAVPRLPRARALRQAGAGGCGCRRPRRQRLGRGLEGRLRDTESLTVLDASAERVETRLVVRSHRRRGST